MVVMSFSLQSAFVVNNEQSGSQVRQPQYAASPGRAVASMTAQLQSATRSPAERKKDIVAQAMQEQKIFEDSLPKTEVKQEPGLPQPQPPPPVAIVESKVEISKPETKPVITATKSIPVTKTSTVTSKPAMKPSQQVNVEAYTHEALSHPCLPSGYLPHINSPISWAAGPRTVPVSPSWRMRTTALPAGSASPPTGTRRRCTNT